MKPKTMILMVVAVGCGLGASYMTSRLLAERNAKPQEVQTVPVLVAKMRVPGWQPIKDPEKYFEIKEFPQDVAPRKALSNFSDVKDQRLNKPVDEGKPISQDDLLTKEQEDVGSKLLPGQRAIAIKVSAESLAGGFVLPGTRVDVICTTRGNDPTTKVVLQSMLVLALDTQNERNPEQKSIIAQTVTLAATPNEAARLTLASSIGELRLALKGNGDNRRIGQVIARASDLDKPFSQSETSDKADAPMNAAPVSAPPPLPELPPEAARAEEPVRSAPPVEKPRKRHVMTIINGTQREKAIFHDDDDEDVASSPPVRSAAANDPAKNEEKADKPEAKKDASKPADKPAAGAPSPFGKSNRAKRIQ